MFTSGGLTVPGGNEFTIPLQNTYRYEGKQRFSVCLNEIHGGTEDVYVTIGIGGRHSVGTIAAKLICADMRDVTNE